MANSKKTIADKYRGVQRTYAKYWNAYGGWGELAKSPYFHFSLFLSICCFHGLTSEEQPWFELVLVVIPTLLGFTLAGYAFLIGVGDERFRTAIRGKSKDGSPSPFMQTNAAFVHFIVLQFFAVIFAVAGKSLKLSHGPFAFLGVLVFFYALVAALAAVFAILVLADWSDKMPKEDEPTPEIAKNEPNQDNRPAN